MNRLRRLDRREKIRYRPASIYSPDPGDASVEYYYLEVQEKIRLSIIDMRAYPNEGPREKERFLANAIAPRSRTLRALLTVILTLYRVGREPGKREANKERA